MPSQSKQVQCTPQLNLNYSDIAAIIGKIDARVEGESDSWMTACRDWCDLAAQVSMEPATQNVLFRYIWMEFYVLLYPSIVAQRCMSY